MTSLFNQQLQEQRRFIQLVTMENLPEVLLYNGYICKKNANISIFFKVEDKEAGTFWFNDGCPNEFTYVAGGNMVEGSTTYTNIHDYMMDGGMDELEPMPAKDCSNAAILEMLLPLEASLRSHAYIGSKSGRADYVYVVDGATLMGWHNQVASFVEMFKAAELKELKWYNHN